MLTLLSQRNPVQGNSSFIVTEICLSGELSAQVVHRDFRLSRDHGLCLWQLEFEFTQWHQFTCLHALQGLPKRA